MADKKLTPMDINKKEFTRRGRRGYDRYEVDSFLDQIIEDYGNTLDKNADLNNSLTLANERLQEYKAKADEYEQKKSDLNQSIISAQEAAKKIKADAQKEAAELLKGTKDDVETKYQQQQKEVLANDYDRLKKEVAEFRNHIQSLLQKQIDDLTDDEWQHALDKYFNTNRFYPDDGSQPIPMADESDFENKQVDNTPDIDVNSYHSRSEAKTATSAKEESKSKRQTVKFGNTKPKRPESTKIVFPEEDKRY